MAELFGFRLERVKEQGQEQTFTAPDPQDGTLDVAGGGFWGQVLDTDGRERTDIDLIKRYRDIAQQSECDAAVEDIVNDSSDSFTKEELKYVKREYLDEFD